MNGNDTLQMGVILNKRYKIIRSLGSGGFSIAYLAYDTELEVNAAIKECFPFQLAARGTDGREVTVLEEKREEFEGLKSVFQKEAALIYGIYDQPGICAVKDFFTENNTVYIVEEFLSGGSLKEYLKKQSGGRIAPEECLEMFRPVMGGIAMLHEKGAVHGDISPDNLLFDEQGRLKLVDFGSVYIQGDGRNANRTFKPCYAAPEQYLEEDRSLTGPWTDLYALCSVLYECLTGKRPLSLQERIKNKSLKPVREYAEVTPACEQGILQGMEPEISRRFFYMGILQERIGCPDPGVRERLPKTREIWGEKWMQAATEGLHLNLGRKRFFTPAQKKLFLKAEAVVAGVFGAFVLSVFLWTQAHPDWALDKQLLQLRVKAYRQENEEQTEQPQMTVEELDEETLASLEPYLSSEGTDGTKYYYNIPREWFLEHPACKSRGSSVWTDTKLLIPDVPFLEKVLSRYAGKEVLPSETGVSGSCVLYGDGDVSFSNTGENIYYLPDGGQVTLQYDAETERLSEVDTRGSAAAMTAFLKEVLPYIAPGTYLTDEEIKDIFSQADTVSSRSDGNINYGRAVIRHMYYRLSLSRDYVSDELPEAERENGTYRIYINAE
ncbi:MAG: serine/threonine protein kinase [Eubacterium sp.]|nr:serine/threonine protein kinase [Eubacterium sp.]